MMNFKEAAKRIEDHMSVHRLSEYPKAEKITDALEMAIQLLLWMNDRPDLIRTYVMDKKWAIVGFDRATAERLMASIEVQSGKQVLRRRCSKYDLSTEFTDGTILRWLEASDSSRGYKVGRMWCDKNIDSNTFRAVVLPLYYGKKDDIIWL